MLTTQLTVAVVSVVHVAVAQTTYSFLVLIYILVLEVSPTYEFLYFFSSNDNNVPYAVRVAE